MKTRPLRHPGNCGKKIDISLEVYSTVARLTNKAALFMADTHSDKSFRRHVGDLSSSVGAAVSFFPRVALVRLSASESCVVDAPLLRDLGWQLRPR